MIDKALSGSKRYWGLVAVLAGIVLVGFITYLRQYKAGLGITGMSRDVSWGLYIGQFTFLVGIAASAVMLVIPYYLHDYKKFGKIVILGEFLAVSAVSMCVLFILVDMGQPLRSMNVLLYPTPNSMMFWDFLSLFGYLILNLIIGWTVINSERKMLPPPKWIKPLIYLSVPWAISIHTVTAFLYAGLPGRELWLTAIMAARFLASAFAGGPAMLILLALIVRRTTRFDPGKEAVATLGKIITYAMAANVFFLGLEFFTAFYSGMPGHQHPLLYLYTGLEGHTRMVPLMWASTVLAVLSLSILLVPPLRRREPFLATACVALFASLWIDKGLGLIVGGFVPNPFEQVTEYWPTWPEALITLGIWALGFLVLTVLYKIVVTVREETA